MKACEINQEVRDDLDVLHLDGSLDAHSFARLETVLAELREQGRHRVILDCSKLHYLSSIALGALIGFARQARERGGDMKLANLSPKIRSLIETLEFHKVLDIHEKVDEAFATFGH